MKHYKHLTSEQRYQISALLQTGFSEKGRLLIVSHTFIEESESSITIRIISSRKATKKEIKAYGD